MSSAGEPSDITLHLRRWHQGEPGAYDDVVALVYQRLLAIATGLAARDSHATSPAALVNEAYLRLRQLQRMEWKDRDHFFSFAATQMRRILIERARSRLAAKREGRRGRVDLTPDMLWTELPPPDVLDLDAALDGLAEADPALLRLVELRYLMGYSVQEISELTALSDAAIERHLRFARAWLSTRLNENTALQE
jgi:RNA polymerase sigma factor (TIGR02999 family)